MRGFRSSASCLKHTDRPGGGNPGERAIRVFVSSTFVDMQAERDELVKRVFPAIRRMCEARGVMWSEVDLRWGLTDEQKAEDKVLPICLEEVRRSRPFFLCLLGERYGWIPEIPDELIETVPWLASYRGRSATELEILEGALNDPATATHVFFYFRNPAAGPRPDDAAAKERMTDLKSRIRSSGLPVRENFRNPRELGAMVLRDLTTLVERLFPDTDVVDPLDRESAAQEAFADTRRKIYLARRSQIERLDEHVRGGGPPLVVTGDGGIGKSALLANWADHYRQTRSGEAVFCHYVGATPASTEWDVMLRRIIAEVRRYFDIPGEIPDDAALVRVAFANTLHQAASRTRFVLVLDGLNQLADRDLALDLVWLPPEIPPNARIIVSTTAGRPLRDLERRGWPTMRVEPLDVSERAGLIDRFLAHYSKALDRSRGARIAQSENCGNPLYLRALLEELRVFGVHERLDERIGHYLQASAADALFSLILDRWEQDYQMDRPDLVRDAMSLIWAAKSGVAEAELLDLLGGRTPLPRAFWSPLFLAAGDGLMSRSGLLAFSHDYLRDAVGSRYLPVETARTAIHRELADYFASREISARVVDELPWQLERAGEWRRLYDVLADPEFLDRAWKADKFAVRFYWSRVEDSSDLRAADAYRDANELPDKTASLIAHVLFALSHFRKSAEIFEHLAARFQRAGDLANLQMALKGIIESRSALGERQELLEVADLRARVTLELGMKDEHLDSLLGLARRLTDRGRPAQVLGLLDRVESLGHEWGRGNVLAGALRLRVGLLAQAREFDAALEVCDRLDRIYRERADRDGLQRSLGDRAGILLAQGALEPALEMLTEQGQISRGLGDRSGLASVLQLQGMTLDLLSRHDEAGQVLEESITLCHETGNKAALAIATGALALHRDKMGDLDGALTLLSEQERLCREVGHLYLLQSCLANQGLIHDARGNLDAAVAAFTEQARICRELGIRPT